MLVLLLGATCAPKDPDVVRARALLRDAAVPCADLAQGRVRVKSSDREACLTSEPAFAKAICSDDSEQAWEFVCDASGGGFAIRGATGCLAAGGGSASVAACADDPSQRWTAARNVHGKFLLRNEDAGRCLDYGEEQYGAGFALRPCRAAWPQLWLLAGRG